MSGLVVNQIPPAKRIEYMRKANEALYAQSGPCPFAAYGTIIVNHTADEVVCEGANFRTGDPTIHGEISAINACTAKFVEKGMTATEIYAAWGELSLYTNAESCPMLSTQCASAIRWSGFKEYIYGTTIQHNYNVGWGVMTLSSNEHQHCMAIEYRNDPRIYLEENSGSAKPSTDSKRMKFSESVVCKSCSSINFSSIFDINAASLTRVGLAIVDLRDRHSPSSTCNVCRFLYAMRCPGVPGTSEYPLRAFSFFREYCGMGISKMPGKITTKDCVCLAVLPGKSTAPISPETLADLGSHSSRSGHILRAEACIPVDLAFCGKVRGMTVDYESIRSWITYCRTHHTGVCATSSPLVPGLQLIDCAKRRIVEARASDQYCALSYAWGSREERTRQQSISETGEKLLLASKLPQSLEDAIEVTKKLGFQYLWIDQYCIDQDDLEQKHHQISRMDSIYARADVTIIAAAGEDQADDLPGVRSTVRVAQPQAHVEDLQLISTMGDPRNAIEDAKWSTRGWTYQEAVLSRRRVAFADTVVYFECNQMNCCETVQLSLDMLHRHDQTAFMGFMRSGFFSGRAGQAEFESFNKYHNKGPDSNAFLRAFAGTMSHLSRETEQLYLWGIPYDGGWELKDTRTVHRWSSTARSLARSLCWFHMASGVRLKHGFPSWAWAGWADKPQFWYSPHEDDHTSKRPRVLSCRINNIKATHEQGQAVRSLDMPAESEAPKDLEKHPCLTFDGFVLEPLTISCESGVPYVSGSPWARGNRDKDNMKWMLSEDFQDHNTLYQDTKTEEIQCLLLAEYDSECFFLLIRWAHSLAYRIGAAIYRGIAQDFERGRLLKRMDGIRLA
ncbi:cytidine deaminase-like protein [Seiridium cupressi]